MSARRPPPAPRASPLHAVIPALLLALAASLLAPSPAAPGGPASLSAQTADPLRKSDLVRLLAAGTPEEVAASIRQRCLSFQPTPRDMEDLRAMGAGPAVMDAIGSCIAASPNGAAGDGAGSLPEAELTLFLDPRRARVAPGGSVDVRAEVTGGAIPAPGVELVLLGAGGDTLGRSTTDPEGSVRFDLPAGEEPGVRRFRVIAPGREVRGASFVEVEVTSETGAGGGFVPASRRMEGAGAGEASGPSPALRRAERLSLSGQYGRAERIYREELEEDPQGVFALLGYGLHLARTGRHGEAERVLQQARRAAPERGDVARALGMVALWRGEPGEAVTWLRAAVEASPEDAEAWAALARALTETGRRDEARRALERARSLRDGSEGGRGRGGGAGRR